MTTIMFGIGLGVGMWGIVNKGPVSYAAAIVGGLVIGLSGWVGQ